MFKEWKAIFKKPTFIIVMIGISLIPALYNIIFLSSMWDPYGKLSELPVAIVNKDQAATYNDEKLTIGEDMVSNLKDSNSMDFHFVDEGEGERGLRDGDYYMVVTLPSNLSEKASSILTNHPEQMTIDYQTSSGHSFTASKMSDSAMTQMKQTVATNVTQSYTKALFKKMGDLKIGLSKAANASLQLADGSNQLSDGSQTLTTNLQTLAQSSLTFSNGADQLSTGLGTYTAGVNQLNLGLGNFNTGLNQYTSAISQIDNGLNQLNSQTPALVSGLTQLDLGTQAYTGGVSQLNSGLNQFSLGIDTYTNGVQSLSSGANQISTKSEILRTGLTQLNQGIQELSTQLDATTQQKDKIKQLATSLEQFNQAIQTADSGEITQVTNKLSSSLSTIANSAQSIITSNQAEKETTLSAIQSTSAYQSLTPDQQAEITSVVSNQSSSTSESVRTILTTVQTLQSSLENVTTQTNSLTQLKNHSSKLLPTASSTLTSLSSGLTQIQTAIDGQLLPASQTLSGIDSYTKSVDQVALGASQLSSKSSNLTGSFNKLLQGSNQLTEKSSTLTSATAKLAANGPELATGIDKLASGVNQVNNKTSDLTAGFNQLQAGSQQLADKSDQLISGANQLDNGSEKIASGADQLAQGSEILQSGLGKLSDGSSQLNQGLTEAEGQLQQASTEPTNADLLADPLSLSKTDADQVAVNGIAMAPYMISVALFVAAISTNMIFAKLPSGRHPESRWAWFKSRFEINGIIAGLAGVLVYGGVHLIGLTAVHEFKTLALIILTSLAFMAMVTALTTWNSRLGAFFSLILLLLQLASSAGTYPLALTNQFFKTINPWLPMSYSVSGLRQTISMTGNIHSQIIFLIFTVMIFVALGMLAYQPKKAEED
ncbi:YhgE/Pip family protein [Streptococcus sp. 27098_8_69]|uniref:YhgE/Pip family protein n=1 Tax=Streptococcus sp. 27098_8_69 TaxID=3003664 RepID=UPI00352E2066